MFAFVQEAFADPSKQVKLGFVSGLVAREKSMAFERFLFRATRGNVFLKQVVVENTVTDPVSGTEVDSSTSLIVHTMLKVIVLSELDA